MKTDSPTLEPVLMALRSRQRFLLTSHARPDGDAVGSLLALSLLLEQMGKQVEILLRGGVPRLYRYLPGADRIRSVESVPEILERETEAAVLLECSSFSRTHIRGWKKYFTINIDHHCSVRPFGDVNWIDSQACATAEMIYHLARAASLTITAEIATCLYTGIAADTGSFIFPNTTAQTLGIAADLARLGADPHRIAQTMYLSYPAAKMKMLGAALQNLQIAPPLAWVYVTSEDLKRTGAREEDAEGLCNYALGMEGISVAAFFRPAPHGYRVSLRSKNGYDVCAIAEEFGGGGHRQASGFSQAGELQPLLDRVLTRLRALVAGTAGEPSATALVGAHATPAS